MRLGEPLRLPTLEMRDTLAAAERSERARGSALERTAFAFAVVLVVLVLRRIDVLGYPQFWAEDGNVFYGDVVAFGPLATLARSYAGYLHLLPRLLADAGALLPDAVVPAWYALCGFVGAAFCCSLFAHETFRFLMRSDLLRACVCVAIALVPHDAEIVGNIANLQWFAAIAVFLVIAIPERESRTASRFVTTLTAVGVFFGVMTAPEALLALPFALAKLRDSTGIGRPVAAAFLVGAGLQGWALAHAHVAKSAGALHADAAQIVYGVVVALVLRGEFVPLLGTWISSRLTEGRVLLTCLMALGASAVGCVELCRRLDADTRSRVLGAVALAIASIALTLTVRTENLAMFMRGRHVVEWYADRYFFLSEAVFIFLVAVAVERLVPGREARKAMVLMALFSLGLVKNFHSWPYPAPVVPWGPHVRLVAAWRDATAAGKHPRALVLPIEPAGWKLELPPTRNN